MQAMRAIRWIRPLVPLKNNNSPDKQTPIQHTGRHQTVNPNTVDRGHHYNTPLVPKGTVADLPTISHYFWFSWLFKASIVVYVTPKTSKQEGGPTWREIYKST